MRINHIKAISSTAHLCCSSCGSGAVASAASRLGRVLRRRLLLHLFLVGLLLLSLAIRQLQLQLILRLCSGSSAENIVDQCAVLAAAELLAPEAWLSLLADEAGPLPSSRGRSSSPSITPADNARQALLSCWNSSQVTKFVAGMRAGARNTRFPSTALPAVPHCGGKPSETAGCKLAEVSPIALRLHHTSREAAGPLCLQTEFSPQAPARFKPNWHLQSVFQ